MLPAPAGMVPGPARSPPGPRCAPRARGDGPGVSGPHPRSPWCSPRPRGWSRRRQRQHRSAPVLPAPAGMVLRYALSHRPRTSAPRARGDGPGQPSSLGDLIKCSPRPRGWSRAADELGIHEPVLPASAGMVPGRASARTTRARAPRARGDGPAPASRRRRIIVCSPRPRGLSRRRGPRAGRADVLPAPAGMISTGDLPGADLARIALRHAREAAKARGQSGIRKAKRPARTAAARRDGPSGGCWPPPRPASTSRTGWPPRPGGSLPSTRRRRTPSTSGRPCARTRG